eukprot:CAMPEP_0117606694 /NCGR_PEP_ID=MMETSP0784-20121206/79841_1 /TAXON_ID=39447 /ORGANISM="" /LENGTH=161 /DNA_ID=CAMNT_0005409777 /DNA_START=545 /DNA_END=1031 /DNA_ORIENTATION=-
MTKTRAITASTAPSGLSSPQLHLSPPLQHPLSHEGAPSTEAQLAGKATTVATVLVAGRYTNPGGIAASSISASSRDLIVCHVLRRRAATPPRDDDTDRKDAQDEKVESAPEEQPTFVRVRLHRPQIPEIDVVKNWLVFITYPATHATKKKKPTSTATRPSK